MHEKSLRNKKLLELLIADWDRTACVRRPPFSSFNQCLSTYPKRSESKYDFQPTGGFHQHPNSTYPLKDGNGFILPTYAVNISLLAKSTDFIMFYFRLI
jgi:hypothetical protein